jgi:hypothetical protein
MKVTKQSNDSGLRLLVEDSGWWSPSSWDVQKEPLYSCIIVRYACSCKVRRQGSSLHKVRIIRVRSSMSGLYFVQTHGACSEGQWRKSGLKSGGTNPGERLKFWKTTKFWGDNLYKRPPLQILGDSSPRPPRDLRPCWGSGPMGAAWKPCSYAVFCVYYFDGRSSKRALSL